MPKSLVFFYILLLCTPIVAQKNNRHYPDPKSSADVAPVNPSLFNAISWRNIGPFRGGRSAAVTGVAGKPNLFYFGGTGGGVWRTTDGGQTWENISDGFFGGSIGAIEVAPSDHNTIYVGGGECTVRGNVSSGSGMWKSDDAGRSWKNIGLLNSRHIPRIRVHPTNPDILYAAVLGDLYKSTDERGIFRSKDGGKHWERIHFVSQDVGAVDLAMDPTNPRILYASFWRVRRSPYDMSSGGAGSGIWKSSDGGDTWIELTHQEGLPKDTLGIIGLAVSPVNPDRVFAIVESETGGVFRSDDAGKKWIKVNEDRSLRQRAWYYSRIYADTKDADVVYVVNVAYHKSKDGGRTFQSKYAPHGDHHDLWIDPEDAQRMIVGDDGGAQISLNSGENWTTYHNQPTAQFYRLATDNAFPFHVYAAQQDNTSVRIAHRSDGESITERDWEPSAGGESATLAVDPLNNEVVYGGEYHGLLTRVDHQKHTYRAINVWPEDNMGHGAEDARYRFQWNYPVFFSPHDPKKLYVASNYLHVSTNEGQSWSTISPDLTTNDKNRQKSSGGPITKDNTGVEYYCTIFTAAESPRVKDLIWTGSDDGLVHQTRDGGKTWTNVTPPQLPRWTMINALEPDPHSDGGCYLACTAYKSGDNHPYLFRTKDYGKTWTKITAGIDSTHFTRVVRADPNRVGLLYAGTEQGMYLSLNDGVSWQKFQQNLPMVPITDLIIKDNHLIAATQGRALWSIDDLSPIQQVADNQFFMLDHGTNNKAAHLLKPAPAYRMNGSTSKVSKTAGENQANGTYIHFILSEKPTEKDTITLAILEADGDTIKVFSTSYRKISSAVSTSSQFSDLGTVDAGDNCFVWNMRYPSAEKFDGMVLWSYDLEGPKAIPGTYLVRLTAMGTTAEQQFDILADPRANASHQDFTQQFDFVQSVSQKLTKIHRAIREIRGVRSQMMALTNGMTDTMPYPSVKQLSDHIDSTMTSVEEALYQTKNRSAQDPLNFPVRLNDKLANLMGLNVMGDFPPTQQSLAVRTYLFDLADKQLFRWQVLKEKDLPRLNTLVRDAKIDIIKVKY